MRIGGDRSQEEGPIASGSDLGGEIKGYATSSARKGDSRKATIESFSFIGATMEYKGKR